VICAGSWSVTVNAGPIAASGGSASWAGGAAGQQGAHELGRDVAESRNGDPGPVVDTFPADAGSGRGPVPRFGRGAADEDVDAALAVQVGHGLLHGYFDHVGHAAGL
jgi:hypothetical protein